MTEPSPAGAAAPECGGGARAAIVPGLLLVLVGVWLLLGNLGVDVAPAWELWPLVLVAIGGAQAWDFLTGRNTSAKRAGTSLFLVLLGVFFLGFSLGAIHWVAMVVLWPVFLLIAGCSRLAAWIAGNFTSDGQLIFGSLEFSAGAIALLFTSGVATRYNLGTMIATAWPLGLVAIGLFLVASAIVRGRRRRPAT